MLYHGKIYFEKYVIQLEFERIFQKKYTGKGNSLAKVLPWPAQGRSFLVLFWARVFIKNTFSQGRGNPHDPCPSVAESAGGWRDCGLSAVSTHGAAKDPTTVAVGSQKRGKPC